MTIYIYILNADSTETHSSRVTFLAGYLLYLASNHNSVLTAFWLHDVPDMSYVSASLSGYYASLVMRIVAMFVEVLLETNALKKSLEEYSF